MATPRFLADYILYNSGNECPRNYHIWAAFAVLSAVVGRKVYVNQGYFTIYPNLYVCLVGDQGSRKSTAKDIARDLLIETFPDIPMAASVQTREAITKFLSTDESIRTYTDENGILTEYHPFVLFVNEFKNFLSVNPAGMIDFLTDIYDRQYFDVGTKNKGTDIITNPIFTMLGCETPDWIVRKLREDIISGGFSRRVLFVYETQEPVRIPFPVITNEAAAAWLRVKAHLKKIAPIVGRFTWTDEARRAYAKWYTNVESPSGRIMRGYYRSKHIQLLKVCMLLALCHEKPELVITEELLETGLATLDSIEENMPKLSIGAGRNELAAPTQRLLETIENEGGLVSEARLRTLVETDLDPTEQLQVIHYLVDTNQLHKEMSEINGKKVSAIMTKQYFAERAARNAKEAQRNVSPTRNPKGNLH